MKNLKSIILAAVTLFVLSVSTFAQKVQLLLVPDNGVSTSTGQVHRIDVVSGRYLGSFGKGVLQYPFAVTVQPSTGYAYVLDSHAVRVFNVSTGRLVRSIAANTFLTLRFDASGNLFALTGAYNPLRSWAISYTVNQLDPTTLATLHSSPIVSTSLSNYNYTYFDISFSAAGYIAVEVVQPYVLFSTFGGSEVDYVDGALSVEAGARSHYWNSPIWVSETGESIGGLYAPFSPYQVQTPTSLTTDGTIWESAANGSSASGFAEGVFGQAYQLEASAGNLFLLNFDVSAPGGPWLNGLVQLPYNFMVGRGGNSSMYIH